MDTTKEPQAQEANTEETEAASDSKQQKDNIIMETTPHNIEIATKTVESPENTNLIPDSNLELSNPVSITDKTSTGDVLSDSDQEKLSPLKVVESNNDNNTPNDAKDNVVSLSQSQGSFKGSEADSNSDIVLRWDETESEMDKTNTNIDDIPDNEPACDFVDKANDVSSKGVSDFVEPDNNKPNMSEESEIIPDSALIGAEDNLTVEIQNKIHNSENNIENTDNLTVEIENKINNSENVENMEISTDNSETIECVIKDIPNIVDPNQPALIQMDLDEDPNDTRSATVKNNMEIDEKVEYVGIPCEIVEIDSKPLNVDKIDVDKDVSSDMPCQSSNIEIMGKDTAEKIPEVMKTSDNMLLSEPNIDTTNIQDVKDAKETDIPSPEKTKEPIADIPIVEITQEDDINTTHSYSNTKTFDANLTEGQLNVALDESNNAPEGCDKAILPAKSVIPNPNPQDIIPDTIETVLNVIASEENTNDKSTDPVVSKPNEEGIIPDAEETVLNVIVSQEISNDKTAESVISKPNAEDLIPDTIEEALNVVEDIPDTIETVLNVIVSQDKTNNKSGESVISKLNAGDIIPDAKGEALNVVEDIPDTKEQVLNVIASQEKTNGKSAESVISKPNAENIPDTIEEALNVNISPEKPNNLIVNKENHEKVFLDIDSDVQPSCSKDIVPDLVQEIPVEITKTTKIEDEPSTSKITEPDTPQDVSEEVPVMTDSLGLLAEASRSMEDEDEADDDDEAEDDEDFDHDEESNQMPEQSEDSNVATTSETDQEIKDSKVNSPQEITDTEPITDIIETEEVFVDGDKVIKPKDLLEKMDIEEIKSVECIGNDEVEQRIDLEDKSISLEASTPPSESASTEAKLSDIDGGADSPILLSILEGKTKDTPTEGTKKCEQSRSKKLEISQAGNVMNIVDLEESSSEDDIQEVTKEEVNNKTPEKESITQERVVTPSNKRVRINTSEITIKTTSSPVESTLVIPEIKVPTVATEQSDTNKEKLGLEIFNVDSDEDCKEKIDDADVSAIPPKVQECVNPVCKSEDATYIQANPAILRYYDVKKKKRRRALVCEECAYVVAIRIEKLTLGIKDVDTKLLDMEMARRSADLVEISDSDTDSEDEIMPETPSGVAAARLLETEMAEIINSTWLKYNLGERMAAAKEDLERDMEKLESESAEIEAMLHDCQELTDNIRNRLYETFSRPIHSLPPLDLDEINEMNVSDKQEDCSASDSEVRRSKRSRTSKDDPPTKRAAVAASNKDTSFENLKGKNNESKDDDIRVVKQSVEAPPAWLPPPGELRRAALRPGLRVRGMRHAFGGWSEAVIEAVDVGETPNFSTCRLKFENKVKGQYKTLLGRHLAYFEPADVRLGIGTRVIALFKDTSNTNRRQSFYAGVIAEVPNPVNKYRYLVFFDDGYAQYVIHEDVRVVCECSSLVWEEVHTFSREFMKSYLLAYPERPMVRLHPGQNLKTEWNGKWWSSRVLAVDASLVNVHFEADNRTEWIYRGSTRLAPLFRELQAAERHRHRALHSSAVRYSNNMPYVEYTGTNEQEDDKQTAETQQEEIKRQRAVAKKSTMHQIQQPPPPTVNQSPPDTVISRVVYYTPKAAVKPLAMRAHACSALCRRRDVLPLRELRTYNPLARPLLSGWERQIVRFRFRKEVMYRAPCGRRLKSIEEVHRYLRETCSDMSVDLFDFNPLTHCLAEFVLNRCLVSKKDLSHGKEHVPVPCVNYYDTSLPEFCSYSTERAPTQGVPLNTDPDFLCGCDCTDDCQDKSKCACWQLTLEGARTVGMEDAAGYVYKRLLEPMPAGIYECNSRCKCRDTCLNRVAQHPLQLKLQVFKTLNRGWGIRALNDVPKGAFLCVYAGNLLTDATANLDGLNEGDEYLAELDYIEVVEQMKEGYEDDIPERDKESNKGSAESASEEDAESSEGEEEQKEGDDDQDFKPDFVVTGDPDDRFSKKLRKREKKDKKVEVKEEKKDVPKDGNEEDCITISDDEEVREPSRFNAAAGMNDSEFVSKYKSVRALYGKDEACYIMDAKVQGNIGRYLNHSCTPNVFVQNVFVDTHDPRFPWVAFFALTHVKAGTELTWNYNYDIGSVPGKILYCYCGAPNCRRRLL